MHDDGEWHLPITNALDLSAMRHWIGFRFKYAGALKNLSASFPLATIGANILLANTDMAFVAGQAYYAEILMDLEAKTRTVLIDGQVIVTGQALSSSTIASTDILRLGLSGTVVGMGANRTVYFKDFVFSSDSGSGVFGRQGSVVFKPITLATTQGDSWTALDGMSTTAAALNKAIATGEGATAGVAMAGG